MHQNVSVCQTIVTSCFDWSGRRNKLVTDGLNFPSNDYIYGEEGAKPGGPRVVRVEAEDGMTLELQRLLDAIDEETLLVSVSHVAFRSSSLLDLQAITEKAHKVGARGGGGSCINRRGLCRWMLQIWEWILRWGGV